MEKRARVRATDNLKDIQTGKGQNTRNTKEREEGKSNST
jgi:hypothetical protein